MHHSFARLHTPPAVRERAREMKASPTFSERKLWQALRGKQLGVAFRRQVCVGRYVADFAAPSARLIVEVDGGWHRGRERADVRRHRALERAGWCVVHVEAEVVIHRLSEAVARVRAAL